LKRRLNENGENSWTIGVRARGAGGCSLQPPWLGQSHYFRSKAKFSGQKPRNINEKKSAFIKRKKTELNLSSEIKCPKSGIFTNDYWVGWVGKSNFVD